MYTVENIRFETRDDYERKALAERVLRFIKQGENNSPLFIDGAWGSGKSEFCYKLFHFLKDSNKEEDSTPKLMVSYINSFAGDYQSNPFMLIVQAIYNSLVSTDASPEEIQRIQRALSRCIGFAKRFFEAGLRSTDVSIELPLTGVSIDVSGGDFIDNIKEGINQENKRFEKVFFEELESFRQQSAQLMGFKSAISEALDGKKLVLIIDELDRCRPDSALELLEHAKHIFDIKGLFIVFSANKEQLEAIIRKRYGYDVDAENYLEKFYKKTIYLTSTIPESSETQEHDFRGHLTVFCNKLSSDTRSRSGKWGEIDFRVLPFIKGILGTLETRKLEKVAEYLNEYCLLTGEALDEVSEVKRALIILAVYVLVTNRELLRDIQTDTTRSKLSVYLRKLPIGSRSVSMMMSYVDADLNDVQSTKEDAVYNGGKYSILRDVGVLLI